MAGFFCVATETTDGVLARERLREGEERQAFLLTLSDALRPLADPVDIQGEAMRLLREHFGVGWCYYLELNEAGTGGTILRDAHRAGLPSLVGFHDLSDIPGFIEHMASGRLLNVPDFAIASLWSPRVVELYTAMGVQSVLAAPLVKQGRPTAALIMVDTEKQAGSERAAALISEVADRTWAALERARAEIALRRSEERIRHALTAPGLGVFDWDLPTDRIECTEGFRTLTGASEDQVITGTWVTENTVHPDDRSLLSARFAEALTPGSGGSYHFEHRTLTHAGVRWLHTFGKFYFEGENDRQHPVRVVGNILDITERKLAESTAQENQRRQAFLLGLSDDIRAQVEQDAIGALVTQRLAEHLRLDRCYLAQLYSEEDRVIVGPEYHRPDLAPASGEYRLSDFPEVVRRVQTQTVVFADVAGDPALTESDKAALGAINIGAFVTAGVRLGDQRVLWALIVMSTVPRAWTPGEVTLVEDIAERTWTAIERARSEAALRDSKATLAAELVNAELLRGLAERLVTEESARTIYDEIMSAAVAVARSDAGTIQLYDPETRSLRLLTTWNFSRTIADRFQNVDASSRTACGLALRTGQRAFVDFADETADTGCALLVDAGFQSALAIPLVSRTGKQLGMLNTHWHAAGHRSTERQLRFLDLIARQAADLIEQRQAQAILRASEERLRQFGEASQDILWIRDAETLQWTYLTPAFEAIYGLSREEALTGDNYRVWQDLIVPEDHARAVASIARVGAGERVTFEYRIRRPSDGEVRWLRNTDFPMRDEAGRVTRIGGVGHDVTAMKTVQAAMAESETRLRTLTEGIPQLVWRSDGEGMWTWCSPQWTDFTGQGQEESHGSGWLDAVHPDDQGAAMLAWEEAQPDGMLDVEYRVQRASDGAWLWHRTRSVPVRDAPGPDGVEEPITEWLGTTTDIDDLKRLQGEQQVLVAELQHRTRNLLALVRNVARRSIGPSTGRDEYDARLAALGRVQGFLSRSAAYAVQLSDLVEAELQAAGDGASGKVEVSGPPVDLPGESVQVVALALHELATNAVKYGAIAQPLGQLSITWRIEAGDDDMQRLVIDWRESGVAMPDGPPERHGYGTELITRALPYQLRAQTALEFAQDGVQCRITLPATAFTIHAEKELA